jgi:nitrogen fixation protein FixH
MTAQPHRSTSLQDGADPLREARTKRIFLCALLGFAAVVLLANGLMITTAVRSWTGLAVDNAYERGLDYNRTLAEAAAQAERGWQAKVALAPGASGEGILSLKLVDAEGQPIHHAEVEAVMYRPIEEGNDFRVVLAGVGAGSYRAEVSFPAPGVWDAFLVARVEADTFHQRVRLLVP